MSHRFVAKLRASSQQIVSSERIYTTKHGTVATMDTSLIGRSPPHPAEPVDSTASVALPAPPSANDGATGYETSNAGKLEWRLPANASGGVYALARYRGIPVGDATAPAEPAEPAERHSAPLV